MGKTTLLGQALRADGDRIDVWLPCTTADRDGERLLARLANACADALDDYRPDARADPLSATVELIVAVAPDRVCLVFDDIHHVDAPDAIDRLLARLPSNGHVLLCGRRLPAVSSARIDTLGGLLQLRQDDLLLTDHEVVEFARQRNVDASSLASAERWPAFVELASRGGGATPLEFLREEVLAALDPERRQGLAAFAAVGGGNHDIALAVSGLEIDSLLDGVPLVRWTGDHAQLHDLWVELLDHDIDHQQRSDVCSTAAAIHRAHGDFDAAVNLRASTDDWPGLIEDIGDAIRLGVDGGLTSGELRRWMSLLPGSVSDPILTLAEGIVERERDPTSKRTTELLSSAAADFQLDGNHTMELVAVLQRGYVARLSREPEQLDAVIERLEKLAEVHRPARPFRAFGQAWAALMAFDNQAQLDALAPVVDIELPPVWAVSRDHLIANALVGLGRPFEAVQIAPDVEALDIPVPGALSTRSQSLWASGRPLEALAAARGNHDRHGARDQFIAHIWTAAMLAWTGDVHNAQQTLAMGRRVAGSVASEISLVQLAAVDMLISLELGRDDEVGTMLASILDAAEPGPSAIEMTLRNHVAVPFVLVADSRDRWNDLEYAGPAIQVARRIAQALVDARRGETSGLSSVDWGDPGFIAITLPCRWAVELGLLALDGGEAIGGRRLIAWLCEHWGDPARTALRRWVDDEVLGDHAVTVLADTPIPPVEPSAVFLLGASRLTVGGYPCDDANWRRERVRALLVWLVVNRSGTRDQIAGQLWPDLSIERAARNLRTTLNYLHGVLEPNRSPRDATWYIRLDGPEVHLDASLDVDVWKFTELLARADHSENAGRVTDALPLLMEAVGHFSGDLAPGLDVEWLDLERIHLRSRFVRASCRAAELLVAMRRPDEAVEIAKAALIVDSYHAASYSALESAYSDLGDASSARLVRARAAERLADF